MVKSLIFVGVLLLSLGMGRVELRAGTLIAKGSQWRFWPGDNSPIGGGEAWAQPEFSDAPWSTGIP